MKLLLSVAISGTAAAAVKPTFACNALTLDGNTYDLSGLKGTHAVSKKSGTPPTTTEALLRFDLCGAVEREGKDEDQCPAGTQACLTLVNHKPSASPPERVTAVIPLWKGEDPETTKVDGGIGISVKGGDWAGTQQSLELTLKCADATADPVLDSYTAGVAKVSWATTAACAKGEDKPPAPPSDGDSDGDKTEPESSGWGFFFALSFLFWTAFFVLLAYFVIGIVYNHQTYSARGWDLVPHRDFWRELPSLASDLGSHLASNVRQSTGRGGYSSLG